MSEILDDKFNLYSIDSKNYHIRSQIVNIAVPILKRYVRFEPKAYEDLLEYLFDMDSID